MRRFGEVSFTVFVNGQGMGFQDMFERVRGYDSEQLSTTICEDMQFSGIL